MAENDHWMIDPPVGPFSPLKDLKAWRDELRQRPPSEDRDNALAEVEDWIKKREG